jgi:hypothetical protein
LSLGCRDTRNGRCEDDGGAVGADHLECAGVLGDREGALDRAGLLAEGFELADGLVAGGALEHDVALDLVIDRRQRDEEDAAGVEVLAVGIGLKLAEGRLVASDALVDAGDLLLGGVEVSLDRLHLLVELALGFLELGQ